jgi:hypothetical protein
LLIAYSNYIACDTKKQWEHEKTLQVEDDIIPFTFADILILRYLMGITDEYQAVRDFDAVNTASGLNWAFRSQLSKFIRRFLTDPYKKEDTIWIRKLAKEHGIRLKDKFERLRKLL